MVHPDVGGDGCDRVSNHGDAATIPGRGDGDVSTIRGELSESHSSQESVFLSLIYSATDLLEVENVRVWLIKQIFVRYVRWFNLLFVSCAVFSCSGVYEADRSNYGELISSR